MLIVAQVAVLLFCAAVVPSGVSGTEARSETAIGNLVVGEDFVDSGMSQALLHRSTLATTDNEALAISFPAGLGTGADGSLASVFSPAIAQTSAGTVAATSTGFFTSNYMFCPAVNYGAAPVGVGQFGAASPVTPALFTSTALMYPEMVVQGNLIRDENGGPAALGISLPPIQSGAAFDTVRGLAAMEENAGATGADARGVGMPVLLSSRVYDFDATPPEIDQTSIVERLWRNTHQGSVMDYAYEGDAAFPTWIAPVKNPFDLIDCGDPADSIKSALEIIRPGTVLTPSFWSI